MIESNQLLVFSLTDKEYALNLSFVERIVRAVEVTPLPKAPDVVLGVVNVQGRIIPVINCRKRFGLPDRDICLSDRFIIARGTNRTFALVADEVKAVVELPKQQITAADEIVQGTAHLEGIAKCGDSMILILDVETLLSFEEAGDLDSVLGQKQRERNA
jgi:purine-binding chemotaxis protein CheW